MFPSITASIRGPLCVSVSPLSAHSKPWTPAAPPGAGHWGQRPACPGAGRTWLGREGAAAGGPVDTWSGCSAAGRRSRTAPPPAASASRSGPCRRRHLHGETHELESHQGSLVTKYKHFVAVLKCVFRVSVLNWSLSFP